MTTFPTEILAFAIDEDAAGIKFKRQETGGPFCPPTPVRRRIWKIVDHWGHDHFDDSRFH
jgi:hypothetical protein